MYELENDDEIEIDLRELFLALKKKIVWILLTAIVFAGASGLITKFAMTPIYSSTAQLYVVSKGGLFTAYRSYNGYSVNTGLYGDC